MQLSASYSLVSFFKRSSMTFIIFVANYGVVAAFTSVGDTVAAAAIEPVVLLTSVCIAGIIAFKPFVI